MKDRVQFYSVDDMSAPYNLQKAEHFVDEVERGWKPEAINDIIEMYHIYLYVAHSLYPKQWTDARLSLILSFQSTVAMYFSGQTKESIVLIYKETENYYRKTFWQILGEYAKTDLLDEDTIRKMLSGRSYELREILLCKNLVVKYDKILTKLILENNDAAEWLLSEYVAEDTMGEKQHLNLPTTLTQADKESIILRYLDSENPNLNYVRLICNARNVPELNLSPETILKAVKLERELNDSIFTEDNKGIPIRYRVCMVGDKKAAVKYVDRDKDNYPTFCYNRQFLLDLKEEQIPMYCAKVFEMMTQEGLIQLVSKSSDKGVLERLMGINSRYAYDVNISFKFNEAISWLQVEAMQDALKSEGRCVENALKNFYEKFLKTEYGYPSRTLALASVDSDWITKCKSIAPVIDSLAREYSLYLKHGVIDEELLALTSPINIVDVKSFSKKRYYSISEDKGELKYLFYIFFSDQCMLTYVDPVKDKHYRCFYDMLKENDGKISYNSYENYQIRDIDYLLNEGYLSKSDSGFLTIERPVEIEVLNQLNKYQVVSYLHYDTEARSVVDDYAKKEWVKVDNHLLAKPERDYFSYYMYNTPFSNCMALKDKYIYGGNADATKEAVHKYAYYRLLILLTLTLIKIEDDLKIRKILEDNKRMQTSPRYQTSNPENFVTIAEIADVYTSVQYKNKCNAKPELQKEQYLTLPKKFWNKEGYSISNYEGSLDDGYVLVLKADILPAYISFFFNSPIGRLLLQEKDFNARKPLTVDRIKGILIRKPIIDHQVACANLEMLFIVNQSNLNSDMENNKYLYIRDFLNQVREYAALELMMSDRLVQYDVHLLDSLSDEMQSLSVGSNPGAIIDELYDHIIKPGNPLMDNLKKCKIAVSKTMNSK